jgi:tetratricopeptide (TPR) repeat protein
MPASFKPHSTFKAPEILNTRLVHLALIFLLGLAVYSNTFTVPFQWDEDNFITNNPVVKDLSFFLNLWHAKGESYRSLAERYVGFLTFALNYKIHGLDVTGYHVFNLAIHILNAALLYFLVVLTFRTPFLEPSSLRDKSGYIGLFAALLFVSHPVQIEAVTYIFQRLASLVTFFYLLSVVMYIKARLSVPAPGNGQHGRESGERRIAVPARRTLFLYLFSLVSAVLAMKTKENAFTLPMTVMLYEFLFFRGSWRARAAFLLPLSFTLLIIPATLLATAGHMTPRFNPATNVYSFDPTATVYRDIPRWDYFITQARVLVTYTRLLFLPFNQNIDYDYPLFSSLTAVPVFLSFLFLAIIFCSIAYLLYRSRWRRDLRLVAFGLTWFFVTISVESGIQPLPQVIDEYRLYLPLAGAMTAAAASLFLLKERVRSRKTGAAVVLLAVCVAILLSTAAYTRNSVWKTKIGLWEDAAAKSPRKANPHINLGVAYHLAGELDKAIRQYQWALRLKPFREAYYYLCDAYARKDQADTAISYCQIAVSMNPYNTQSHYNLGRMYFKKGLLVNARNELGIAVRQAPDFSPAKDLLRDIADKTEEK